MMLKKMVKLSDQFAVTYGNKFDLNKMKRLSRSLGGVNFVGRSSRNHGISAVVSPLRDVEPFPAGCLTVALGGTKLLSSFVQEEPFYTAQNVAVLRARVEMSFQQKLFVCLCIRHNRFRYSAFGREANRTIKTLEIPDVSTFPKWVGLTNAYGRPIASLVETIGGMSTKRPVRPDIGPQVQLGEIFDVVYGTNLELNRLALDEDGINFVSRTSQRNGVSARVKRLPEIEPIREGVLTVAGGGSVLETFLQTEPFYSGRDLYYMRPKIDLSMEELFYYCICLRANKFRFSYGRQANRTLAQLYVPSPRRVPSWVYGSLAKTAVQIGTVCE